jgi:hypothetical protein
MEKYTIIAYLIGENRYKQLLFEQFDNRQDVVSEYRSLLNTHYAIKEFVIVMLNNDYKILTAWALDTPVKLIEAAKIALNMFESGDDLYIDEKLAMINLFGTQVCTEIITEGKIRKFIPNDYVEDGLTEDVTEGIESETP